MEYLAKKNGIKVEGKIVSDMEALKNLNDSTSNLIMEEKTGIVPLFECLKLKELLTDKKS